jgi:hypothetical protein
MEEKEMEGFSLTTLFLVTGFCFLSFALALRILDSVTNKLFLWIGFITFVSGVLTGTCILIDKKTEQRKAKP